ncbi:beta-defensin 110 isoform X2 [Camelus dromedarius]|uniref:Beta-defensin 110 isoform X2 n=3 Tax=Camelidae TaxID=9835 RepID=A0A8B8RP66_CAMFR|nr:beta-defensin 110 isoform X2 [Camelus dromedarius]XP_032319125.1 beta-defensin 110 isoform X2 [Camelus ferus]XP_045365321.1 beta-defensin 110 isoform X2 [Camelus bactrianus]
MKIHLFFFILLFWVTILQARSELEPKYRFERCQAVKGTCKTFCDDVEYDYGYCIRWRNRCCI